MIENIKRRSWKERRRSVRKEERKRIKGTGKGIKTRHLEERSWKIDTEKEQLEEEEECKEGGKMSITSVKRKGFAINVTDM